MFSLKVPYLKSGMATNDTMSVKFSQAVCVFTKGTISQKWHGYK